jgi:hypothetical protein
MSDSPAEAEAKPSIPEDAIEAAAAWFSHWMGASSIRRRDREYAREVLERAAPILIAAGRAQAATDRDALFELITEWAEVRGVRGYLTFADIEQLATNIDGLIAAGGGVADLSMNHDQEM